MANYLADRRLELGLTQKDIAEAVGVTEATVSRWESGSIANMRRDKIAAYAKILRTTADFIMTGDKGGEQPVPPGFSPIPELDTLPIVGRIACGTPILAEQNIEGSACMPARWRATFSLICKGDSMEPKIHDGDLVAIRKQPEVENGEIAAVRIGEEATLKRVYRHENMLELRPENPTFESIILVGEDMGKATIEGKAVGLCRDI